MQRHARLRAFRPAKPHGLLLLAAHTRSVPTRLHAACLLALARVQYTRVAPARGFDTLDDDFNYGLLVTALVGLSTASLLAHIYTKRTNLAAKWK